MALVDCRECSGRVSTEATACPHCGALTHSIVPELRVRPLVVIGGVLGALGAMALLAYGTLSPCRMLEQEAMLVVSQSAGNDPALWTLGGALLRGTPERLGLSPVQCLQRTLELRFGR